MSGSEPCLGLAAVKSLYNAAELVLAGGTTTTLYCGWGFKLEPACLNGCPVWPGFAGGSVLRDGGGDICSAIFPSAAKKARRRGAGPCEGGACMECSSAIIVPVVSVSRLHRNTT